MMSSYIGNLTFVPVEWKLDSLSNAGRTTLITYENHTILESVVQNTSYVAKKHPTYVAAAEKAPEMRRSNFYLPTGVRYPDGTRLSFVYDQDRIDLQEFPAGNSYPKLTEISLGKGDGTLLRFKFAYAYFFSDAVLPEVTSKQSGTYHADRYSLKLKSITKESGNGASSFLLYAFQYNDLKQRRFGKGLDYYGYYNGGTIALNEEDHSILHPGNSSLNADKSYNISAAYGLLTGISNGYGGSVEFRYGLHTGLVNISSALSPTGTDVVGQNVSDGVRVDTIVTTDKYNPYKRDVQMIEYFEGQRFVAGGYCVNGVPYSATIDVPGNIFNNIHETFVSPTLLFQGSNHGYSRVVVSSRNKENALLGKTEYRFTNFRDGTDAPKVLINGGGASAITSFSSGKQMIRDWEMGLPLQVKQFDDKGLLLSEVVNTYEHRTDLAAALSMQLTEQARFVGTETGYAYYYSDPAISNSTAFNIRNFKEYLDPYLPYRGKSLLQKTVSYQYASNTDRMADSVTYIYDAKDNKKSSVFLNSKGESVIQTDIYNYDLGSSIIAADPVLSHLQQNDRDVLVGSERWKMESEYHGGSMPSSRLWNASVFKYSLLPGDILVSKSVYGYETEEAVTKTAFHDNLAANFPGYLQHPAAVKVWGGMTLPAYIVPATTAQTYDEHGKVTEAYIHATDEYKVNIFDRTTDEKIAEVMNARRNEVAFADFDNDIDGGLFYNSGDLRSFFTNNSIYPNIATSLITDPPSGRIVLVLAAAGTNSKAAYVTGLTPGKEYRITFWSTNNGIPQFGIQNGVQYTLTQIATRGTFRQYEAVFTFSGSSTDRLGINCSTANIAIDDLRLCPSNAAMQNRSYRPLFGLASETDALGRIIYYEYDALGRPTLTRDHEGNILLKKEYGARQ